MSVRISIGRSAEDHFLVSPMVNVKIEFGNNS